MAKKIEVPVWFVPGALIYRAHARDWYRNGEIIIEIETCEIVSVAPVTCQLKEIVPATERWASRRPYRHELERILRDYHPTELDALNALAVSANAHFARAERALFEAGEYRRKVLQIVSESISARVPK